MRLPDCSCYPYVISPSHDVTLMQILHGKGSTYFGNSDSTSHSIITRCGLESFVYRNRILTKLCRWKLRGPVIMNHRVDMLYCASDFKRTTTSYHFRLCPGYRSVIKSTQHRHPVAAVAPGGGERHQTCKVSTETLHGNTLYSYWYEWVIRGSSNSYLI